MLLSNLTPGSILNIGFTTVKLSKDKKTLSIFHSGNMGNTIKHSVNPNLKLKNIPTVEELKSMYPNFKESGSPDYMYGVIFYLK
jgi:hypothetical protein